MLISRMQLVRYITPTFQKKVSEELQFDIQLRSELSETQTIRPSPPSLYLLF